MQSKITTPISKSWDINAEEWIKVINERQIPSRKITNPAIVDHVLSFGLKNILDLGCGEGWLCRALQSSGVKAHGVDVAARLIEDAMEKDTSSSYQCLSFEEIIDGAKIDEAPFDGIIFNFCIYEKSLMEKLLLKIAEILENKGYVFIQTLHPFTFQQNGQPYESAWVDDSWKGLPGNFKMPHKWYFRTLENWTNLFRHAGLALIHIKEPRGTGADLPSSIIFTLKKTK